MSICILVGHGKSSNGAYDSGAVSKDGKYHEYKIAREIGKYAQEYYNKTYTEKADLMNYDGSLCLSDRIEKVNKKTYDFIAEIHLNAGGGTGVECYYSKGSKEGQKYADKICDFISADLKVKQRPYGTDEDGGDKVKLTSSGADYFGIIRQTKPTAVLIETVFIDTASDLNKVKTASGQKKCGEAIAKAIGEVRGAKKKKAQTSFKAYKVKVICDSLNIRKTPKFTKSDIVGKITDKGTYTITAEKTVSGVPMGKLKSGQGWISLRSKYVKKL